MTILQVEKLPFDIKEYNKKPFHEKVKMACQAYVNQGFGGPLFIYAYHTAKMALFVWIWLLFCSYSSSLGPMETFLSWWTHPEAFAKFIAWWMLFENLGLGSASGPGMLRFLPPHPLAFQYLLPGTLKRPIPSVAKIPIIGGDKRTIVDCLLYAAHIFFLFRACYAPELAGNWELILPTIILLPLLGVMDKMIFLSARGEITYTAYFCFLFINLSTIEFAGFFLFGVYHDVPVFANSDPLLMSAVFGMSFLMPIIGFIWPKYISFLVAMRYYAGNWPISVWLIKPSAEEKIEKRVRKVSPNIARQLAMLKIYPPEAAIASGIRILAFRSLHLLTRGVHTLIPKAINADKIDQYGWREGETQCAHILGWNFGDGHLHNEELIAALHKRCDFEAEELRVIWMESEPLFKSTTDYKIIDGKDGVIKSGTLSIDDLEKELPWQELTKNK